MSEVSGIYEDDLDPIQKGVVSPELQTLRPLSPVEEKTEASALKAIEGTDLPHPSDRLRSSLSYDPAREFLDASLAYETHSQGKMGELIQVAEKKLDLINKLLALSSELTKLDPDKKSQPLSAKASSLLEELNKENLDLLLTDGRPLPQSITQEQLRGLKERIANEQDQLKGEVQRATTKVNYFTQNMMAVNNCAVRAINNDEQLRRKISQNMTVR